MWSWMLYPLIATVVLTGIHVYLGLHVVQRGVIFVDLAVAQLAAFGAILALILGLGSWLGSGVSLSMALLGGFFFAVSKQRIKPVPQEAMIGIIYALAAAGSILLLEKAPAQAHEIKEMLSGNLLFIQPQHLLKMTLIYAVVGGLHYLLRKPMWALSMGKSVSKYGVVLEFAFYASIAVVVTSSVSVAGILMVFAYLTMPAVVALWWVKTQRARLLVGWAVGIVCSGLGLWGSVVFDLPSGPMIVVALGCAVILSWVLAHGLQRGR